MEAYQSGGKLKWAGVWIKGKAGLLNRNMTHQDFGSKRKQREGQGWRLLDIERYKVGGQVKWAAIWERSNQAERVNRNFAFCTKKRKNKADVAGIADQHNRWRNAGFELIDWERD